MYRPKKIFILKLGLSLLAIVVATSILTASLLSSAAAYSQLNKTKWNDRQLYFSDQILPDHLLYPAVMAADHIKLKNSSNLEKIYLETTYANLRLEAAQELLAKNNPDLALTTLTKAEKYLLTAAQAAVQPEVPAHTKLHVLKTMIYHHNLIHKIKDSFLPNQQLIISQLDEECQIFHTQLREQNGL